MDVVQSIELAMEEAFDQEEEILWPKPEESRSSSGTMRPFPAIKGARISSP